MKVDVAVVGTGNAGQSAAGVAREGGRSVAIVDRLAPGGTCALRGCVPKKVLVAAATVMDEIRRAPKHGIEVGPARLDWGALIAREQELIRPTTADLTASFRSRGIALVEGTARFVGPRSLDVDGQRIDADQIVVATGSVARRLDIPGGERCWTSEHVLSNPVRPDPVVFVGSGVIAFELAHVLIRAGSKVTMVGRRALAGWEPVAVERLVAATRRIGIDLRIGMKVTAIEPQGSGIRVRYQGEDGREGTVDGSVAVNATGRVPDLDALDLQAAGIAVDRGRVDLDEQLRSRANPAVSFAGDAVAGFPQLSPTATLEGGFVGERLVGVTPPPLDFLRVPRAVFSLPPLATVGWTEEKARAAGLAIDVVDTDMTGWRNSRTYAEEEAFARVIFEKGTRRILGATFVGHDGPEIIHPVALAIAHGWTAADMARITWTYPTFHSDLKYLLT